MKTHFLSAWFHDTMTSAAEAETAGVGAESAAAVAA